MTEEIYGERSLAANLNTEMFQGKASWRSRGRVSYDKEKPLSSGSEHRGFTRGGSVETEL